MHRSTVMPFFASCGVLTALRQSGLLACGYAAFVAPLAVVEPPIQFSDARRGCNRAAMLSGSMLGGIGVCSARLGDFRRVGVLSLIYYCTHLRPRCVKLHHTFARMIVGLSPRTRCLSGLYPLRAITIPSHFLC